MIDKSKELSASIELVNDKLHFMGNVDGNGPVSIDYIPPFGDNLGYTSLELVLLSLTSCIGSAILIFLRRMKKTILSCKILANGIRKQEHPTGFKEIDIEIIIKSNDITEIDMLKVIELAEDKYCPVWSMLKGNVEVKINFKIEK